MADFNISGEHLGSTCPQCKALFKYPNIPKNLPNCSHVYCVICLRQSYEDEIYSSHMKCPQCQAEILIQEVTEIDELETNEEHMRLAEKQNDLTCNESQHSDCSQDGYLATIPELSIKKTDNTSAYVNLEYRHLSGKVREDDPETSVRSGSDSNRTTSRATPNENLNEQPPFDSKSEQGVTNAGTSKCRNETDYDVTKNESETDAYPEGESDTTEKTNETPRDKSANHPGLDSVSVDPVVDSDACKLSYKADTDKAKDESQTHNLCAGSDSNDVSSEASQDKSVNQPAFDTDLDTRNALEETGAEELTLGEQTTQLQVEVRKTTESVKEACAAKAAQLYKNCQIHTGEDIVYYCLTCVERICLRCVVPKHLNHDVKDLEEANSVLQRRIQEKLHVASKHAEIWKQKILTLKDKQTAFQISLDEEYEQIYRSVKQHMQRIKSEGERLSKELETKNTAMNGIADDRARLSRQIKTLEKALKACKTISTHSMTTFPISEKQSSMLSQLAASTKEANSMRLELDKKQISIPTFQFEEHPHVTPAEKAKTVGRLASILQLSMIQEIKGLEKAYSVDVACAPNGSLLVGDKQQIVTIYRKQNEQYNRYKELKLDKPVLGVAATTDNKYLVSTADGISMFSESGDYLSNFVTFKSNEDKVGLLQVGEGSVFGGHLDTPSITEFDSSGIPVRSINTNEIPLSFALLDNARIAVSYRLRPHVDLFTFGTQETYSANGSHESFINVDLAQCLCFDKISQSLLIGSCRRSKTRPGSFKLHTCVIDRYCSKTGQFVTRLAQRLRSPYGMTLINDEILAVADGKTVKLYSLLRVDTE